MKEIITFESLINFSVYGSEEEKKQKRECLENEFISLLTSDFEIAIARAAIANGFSLSEFFNEGIDFHSVIRDWFEDIALYLDPSHPLNFAKIPLPGKKILLWFLSFSEVVQEGNENVYKAIAIAIRSGRIADIEISEEAMQKFFSIFMVVSVSGEYGKQFNFLIRLAKNHYKEIKKLVEPAV